MMAFTGVLENQQLANPKVCPFTQVMTTFFLPNIGSMCISEISFLFKLSEILLNGINQNIQNRKVKTNGISQKHIL